MVEEFPSRYDVAAARQHRWARGDWQLLPWIFGRVHAGVDCSSIKVGDPLSAIPALGRWKMIDNLRRTLSAPTALIALIVGWSLPFTAALIWTGFVVASIATAPMLPFITGFVPRRLGISKRSHLRAVGTDLAAGLAQIAMLLTLLAHQAWLMSDAIVRTLYRLFVSHRRLLEWVTAAQAKLTTRLDLRGFYKRMAGSVALGTAAAILVVFEDNRTGLVAAPFAILWILAPAIARWASLPPPIAGTNPVSASDVQALRVSARRTWRFFEKFVTAEDHMLPPDNFQEDPAPVLAHRTSPTNLGLFLRSECDVFGSVGANELVERLGMPMLGIDESHSQLSVAIFDNWMTNPNGERRTTGVDSAAGQIPSRSERLPTTDPSLLDCSGSNNGRI